MPARLSDDEIAIATCLERMAHYVETGESFYSLSEASQDHYLSTMIAEAPRLEKNYKARTRSGAQSRRSVPALHLFKARETRENTRKG